MRLAAGVEYDGGAFSGWQRQTGARTVQAVVERALSKVADTTLSVVTGGRTDTGVHATGQVFHFDTHAQRADHEWLRGGNSLLPADVTLLWVRSVPDDFHARFSARSRSYRYIIYVRPTRSAIYAAHATWDYRPLDVHRMQAAARSLVGEHDFSAFQAAGCQAKSAKRIVHDLTIEGSGAWVWFDVRANAFLQHMVRNLVGVLTAIGAGERPVGWAQRVLASRDRRQGGVTAPPEGLYLTAIEYPAEYALPAATPPCRFW